MKKKWIAVLALVLVVALGLVIWKVIVPNMRYNEAEKLLAEGQYDQAAGVFSDLGGFKDAQARIGDTYAAKGESLLKAGSYDEAVTAFEQAGLTDRVRVGDTSTVMVIRSVVDVSSIP